MWTKDNIADKTGKVVIITGANSGIGYYSALALYEKGAHIILACRNLHSAENAITKIKSLKGTGTLEARKLDLASLESVKEFAKLFIQDYKKLDILINNAGVMTPPSAKTAEGYELQFGVNYLGHFALTGYLYPLLKNTTGARVVNVTSLAYTLGSINFNNFRLNFPYDASREYNQSKLANILFTFELQRRIDIVGDSILSVAAHPGVTKTELSRNMSEENINSAVQMYGPLMDAWQGALPSLYAATEPNLESSGFFGPDSDGGLRGYPAQTEVTDVGRDYNTSKKLWDFAEMATGVPYP